MDGRSLSIAAQLPYTRFLGILKAGATIQWIIRSDNGSGCISSVFGFKLEYHRLVHNRFRTHCPEENRLIERANPTFREKLDELELTSHCARRTIAEPISNNLLIEFEIRSVNHRSILLTIPQKWEYCEQKER